MKKYAEVQLTIGNDADGKRTWGKPVKVIRESVALDDDRLETLNQHVDENGHGYIPVEALAELLGKEPEVPEQPPVDIPPVAELGEDAAAADLKTENAAGAEQSQASIVNETTVANENTSEHVPQ